MLLVRIVWKWLQIGTDMLLIITSTDDRLFRYINIDDLERPWTPHPPKKGGFSDFFCNFWMQCTIQHWIATKWLKIDQDNLCMKFAALNIDFSSPSSDVLGSRKPAQAGVKDSYFPKKCLFHRSYFSVVWERLQIGTDMLLIITSNSDKLFIGVNVDDLEWPWTLKIGVFSEFFAIFFPAATHFKSELRRNGWRWTWTTCVLHFCHRTYIFKNLNFDLLNSRSLPHGGLAFKYSFKMH